MMVYIKFAHGRAQNEKGRESKEDAELDEKERGGGGLITLSIARDSSSFAVAVLCCGWQKTVL